MKGAKGKALSDGAEQEPGQTTDGLLMGGVSIGAVRAIDPPDGRVDMIRPEDTQPEPVIAKVPADKVPEWERQGWKVKE